jgi:hypothetical protein
MKLKKKEKEIWRSGLLRCKWKLGQKHSAYSLLSNRVSQGFGTSSDKVRCCQLSTVSYQQDIFTFFGIERAGPFFNRLIVEEIPLSKIFKILTFILALI